MIRDDCFYIYIYTKESNAFIHIPNLLAGRHARTVLKFLAVFSISFTISGKLWVTWPKFTLKSFHLIAVPLGPIWLPVYLHSSDWVEMSWIMFHDLFENNCKNPAFHFEMGHCMVEWSAAASVSSVGACSFWEQPQAHLLVFAMNLSDEEDIACASEAWYAIYAYIISFNMCIYKHKQLNIHNTIS